MIPIEKTPCHFCEENTDSASEDAGLWPVWYAHENNPKAMMAHHMKCVQARLRMSLRAGIEVRPSVKTDIRPMLSMVRDLVDKMILETRHDSVCQPRR